VYVFQGPKREISIWPRALIVNALYFVPSNQTRQYVQTHTVEFGPRSLIDFQFPTLPMVSQRPIFYIIVAPKHAATECWDFVQEGFQGICFSNMPPPRVSKMASYVITVAEGLVVSYFGPTAGIPKLHSMTRYQQEDAKLRGVPKTLTGQASENFNAWQKLSAGAPINLRRKVINGFAFGRSARYEGPRPPVITRKANYFISSVDSDFVQSRQNADVAEGLLEPIADDLFTAGFINPRFVRTTTKQRVIVDPGFVNSDIRDVCQLRRRRACHV
jgi:hypothetical protein